MDTAYVLRKIDFGEIDGYGDPKLEEYFLDDNYWQKIIENKIYFVVGRKGTGKSSIYRMIAEFGNENGYIVENKDFGEFPFGKLLTLEDNDFSRPNQYQTIWRSIILNVFVKAISENPIFGDNQNTHFEVIDRYAKECLGDVIEMHKEVVRKISKANGTLTYKGLNIGKGNEKQISLGDGSKNTSAINNELQRLLINYFLTCSKERRIIIQFDRLDDTYNQYQNIDQYYQAIISLFKVVYQLNQEFRSRNIENTKVILYLRTDILKELGKKDAESARWEDFMYEINWSIINKNEWKNSMLLKMINKRIAASNIKNISCFNDVFNEDNIDLRSSIYGKRCDIFKYIIEKTMHRPRDVIQFCKYIQKEAAQTNKLYYRTIKDAEKKFGYWLINSELANEINPVLNRPDRLYEMLKGFGESSFSLKDFCDMHKKYSDIDMESFKLACYLYDVGILINVDYRTSPPRIYSSFRNKGKFDKNMKLRIHPGVIIGLNA